ncbi:MAG: preprotein translocase subunit SecA [Chloroflexi bacterium]|nr:preprotein translocase subunit SecA [Chloroflexota bacterium]
MFKWLGRLVDSNEKELRRLHPLVSHINSLEPGLEKLTDSELLSKTDEFRSRFKDGESLDGLLPEAYAAVREAAKRRIKPEGQRHFDVQLMGGIVLHHGKIAEMKTGEGKTLVATLPLYLNALAGRGCHLVTVNDYLAKRDCQWMGPVYHALGVSVAAINARQTSDQPAPSYVYEAGYESEDNRWNSLRPISRRQAYEADITYGTNNEFGFDYLRDNMVLDSSQCVQRPLDYAIVDEVDNILVDEARTPLIISGAAEEATQRYYAFARVGSRLKKDEDYSVDERTRTVHLTDDIGITRVEEMLRREGQLKAPNLYDPSNYSLTQYLDNALKARVLFRRDRDYVVKNGQVIIVDEFTGRLMFGRRYSDGLHQAIEAKEGVKIQRESVTLASITFQNYFRMYQKLAGMTGTAATEAEEFHKIYGLEVVVVPTNRPLIRTEHTDQVYKDEKAKFAAVVNEVGALDNERRPVLIGTTSIEKSEYLSDLLGRKGISHQVLNAKNHEKEAGIIAQAGHLGAVTVATNMAGRGVDIILGGNPEGRDSEGWLEEHNRVVQLGGLHIIGTEHHEARRIDNQLRGRAGRQGDPGSSRFYASLEDEIMRRFGGDRVKALMEWAGMDESTPIEHPMVAKAITNSQVQTEGYHFDIRKHLVEYDDVVNKHREVIYAERKKTMGGADLKANIVSMVQEEIQALVDDHLDYHLDELDFPGLLEDVSAIFPVTESAIAGQAGRSQSDGKQIAEKLKSHALALYDQREQEMGASSMRLVERVAMLRVIDKLWMEHLTLMEHMRQGIGLRAAGQQQPLVVYKREGHALFESLLSGIRHDVVRSIYHVGVSKEPPRRKQAVAAGRKVGRNDPCPCGSGRKYKHCCGR